VDAVIERAVVAGANVLLPATNQFWGDRTARTVSSRVEETSSEERDQRWSEIVKS
jgi:hypothetical protein